MAVSFDDLLKEVYDLDEGEVVGCYYCMREHRNDSKYRKGQAWLCGAGLGPLNAEANYICLDHIDNDAIMPDGRTAEDWKRNP